MFLSNNEETIVQNIVNKLTVHMELNQLSVHTLAKSLNFSYQNLNWLMKHKRTPTIGSLVQLCELFNCNLMELISNDYFLDVPYYDSVYEYLKKQSSNSVRIYIPHQDIICANHQFCVIKSDTVNVYYCAESILQEGKYLVQYNDENIIIDVLFSSSKMIIIEQNGKEVKISTDEIKSLAKLYKPCLVVDNTNQILLAKSLFKD